MAGRREPLYIDTVHDSVQEQKLEAYRNDPLLFFKEQVYIQRKPEDDTDIKEVLIPFELNDQQRILFDIIWDLWCKRLPIRLIILKHRQWGCSTLIQAFILWCMKFVGNSDGYLIAQDEDSTERIFYRYKTFLEKMDPWCKPEVTTDRTEKIRMRPQGDADYQPTIEMQTASNAKIGRGTAVRWVHWSEVAHDLASSASNLNLGINQAIPFGPNTMVFWETTANGAEGWFPEEWERCYNYYDGEVCNAYELPDSRSQLPIPVFFPWTECEWYCKQDPDPAFVVGLEAWRRAHQEGDEQEKKAAALSIGLGRSVYPIVGVAADDPEEIELAKDPSIKPGQILWRRETTNAKCQGDPAKFGQEYPRTPQQAFVLSGSNIFHRGYVMSVIEEAKQQPPPMRGDMQGLMREGRRVVEFFEDPYGSCLIFEEPDPDRGYIAYGDVGEGKPDRAFSALEMIDAITTEQVAELHGKWNPIHFAGLMYELGEYFNMALLAPEVTGPGFSTGTSLVERGYPNLFTRAWGKLKGNEDDIGFQMTGATRPTVVATLRNWVRQGMLDKVHSLELLYEIRDWYRNKRGKETHPPNKFDDRLISLGGVLTIQKKVVQYGGVRPAQRKPTYGEYWSKAHRRKRRPQRPPGGHHHVPKGGVKVRGVRQWL